MSMVDPTSSLGTDVTEVDAPQCATCGEPIVSNSDHRVVTWIEANRVRTEHFCDDSCRETWSS